MKKIQIVEKMMEFANGGSGREFHPNFDYIIVFYPAGYDFDPCDFPEEKTCYGNRDQYTRYILVFFRKPSEARIRATLEAHEINFQ